MIEFTKAWMRSRCSCAVRSSSWLPLALLFVLQSDLGTTVICLVAIFAILILGGVPARWIVLLLVLIAALVVAAIAAAPYRMTRFLTFLDPWGNAEGDGYQIVHSLQALASGGLFGVGLGNSYEKLQYLPEAETDFIFAIIGEGARSYRCDGGGCALRGVSLRGLLHREGCVHELWHAHRRVRSRPCS